MTTAAILVACVLPAGAATPEVIAHRGASGYLPEHTLPAYALAYGQGAAWIEPDLVMTREGVLVAVHDVTLDGTTDVAARFPGRARADGRYYVADFTQDEIDSLQVKERLPARFPQEAAIFRVPSFDDVLAMVLGLNRSTGCDVGVFPEIKSSATHHAQGLDPERALLAALARHGLDTSPLVRIQSFEPASLERLRAYGSPLHLVQLIADDPAQPPVEQSAPRDSADKEPSAPRDSADREPSAPRGSADREPSAPRGSADRAPSAPRDSADREPSAPRGSADRELATIARYARSIGPEKTLLVRDPTLVARAHALDLGVVPWTFRADRVAEGFVSFEAELDWAATLGVDALFTDHPDRAVARLGTTRHC